jgi:hypothetical protein
MLKNLLSACFLLLFMQSSISAQSPAAQSTGISDDWVLKAQAYVNNSEYFFQKAGKNRYAVANKKQRTGFIINSNGYTVSPIQVKESTGSQWTTTLQLAYLGKGAGNSLDASGAPLLDAVENKLVAGAAAVNIEYVNTPEGLRQNFIIHQRPAGQQKLVLRLSVSGSLSAKSKNNVIEFADKEGTTRLFYRDLKVWDAGNRLLDASMQINETGTLAITVNDAGARYPITVDPINQTPEWTTSADGILPTLVGQLAVNAAYGFCVAGLGDVNGDGFDDVAVGAPAMVDLISGTGTLASVGAVFVYFGSANGLPVIPSAKLQPTTCVAGALFGYSIAGGDINNDGKSDILVGAPMDNVTISVGGTSTATGKTGKVYAFNGAALTTTTTPFLTIQLSGSNILENGVNLSVKALFGFSVAVTEDLNGDGKKDIIVGAPAYAGIKAGLLGNHVLDVQSGGAFVFLSNSLNNNLAITKLEPIKTSLLGLGLLESNINGLLFGYSVDGLGDYNGDGKPDVVASAPAGIDASSLSALINGKLLQGSALIYYGTGSGVNSNTGAKLTATAEGLLCNLSGTLANVANLFGVAVKGVRNASGVRNGNVLVGAPLGNAVINVLNLQLKTGTVSVFKKKGSSPSGYVVPDQVLSSPRNSNTILQLIQSNLLFGYALDNVLDVNCDGIGDITVGEPASSGVQLLNANVAGGAAYVYLGKADGTYQASPSWTLTAFEDAFLGVNATSLIGYSVAGAGKIKGAGFNSRILVGSPSRTLDFGAGLLNLGKTVSTLFSLVAGNNGVGKAFAFDIRQCISLTLTVKDVLCNGGNTGVITAAFSEGTAPYQIKIDNGTYAAATSPVSFTGLAAGSHTVTVKDANGTEKTMSVTVKAPEAITGSVQIVHPACTGEANGSFTITATGGTGPFTFSKNGGVTYQASNSFNNLPAGTFNWVIKDANGCTKTGQAVLIDPAPITASASATDPTGFGLADGSFTISANGGTGTFTYSKDGGASYQPSAQFTGLACGTYQWAVKDANGCIKNGQVNLVCAPDITVSVSTENPGCNGSATGSFTITASGGTGALTYSKNGGTSYQASGSFTGLTAGTYNWVVKDANGYSKSGQVILTDAPAINVSVSKLNPLCPGAANGSFTLTATGGTAPFTYSSNGGASFQASGSFTGLTAGTYNWVVKDAKGCTKSGQVLLTDPSAITATVTTVNPTYFGAANGSFTINAGGGTAPYTYSRNGGTSFQSSATFTGLPAGTYNYVVKDANGCIKTGTVVLNCPADITVTVKKTNPLCCGAANGSFTLSATGGTGALLYSGNGGTSFSSNNSFTGLAAGTYNWVVKDANGYSKSGQVILTNPLAISASATGNNPSSMSVADGSIKITASGGTGTLLYSRNGGSSYQLSNIFTGLTTGTYNWVVKDANGCTKTGTVTLTCNTAARTAPVTIATNQEQRFDFAPNPAHGKVMLSFVGSTSGHTRIGLYSVTGRYISTVFNGSTEAGRLIQHSISVTQLQAGVYVLQLQNGQFSSAKKLVVIK